MTALLLTGAEIKEAQEILRAHHYLGRPPQGRTRYIKFESALIVWALPSNFNAGAHFLPETEKPVIWNLSRLWAPDGHEDNLLTRAISESIKLLKQLELKEGRVIDLLISYADPYVGHGGTVYQAAGWIEISRSATSRDWVHSETGERRSHRSFHMGRTFLREPEIKKLGYVMVGVEGKHRFVQPLSRRAKKRYEPLREQALKKRRIERAKREAFERHLAEVAKRLAAE